MTDQGQKTITIDDLVNELSKSPSPPPSLSSMPTPPIIPPLTRPSMPQPQNPTPAQLQNIPPKPTLAPVSLNPRPPIQPQPNQPVATPISPQSVKEYQSSIRTMSGDMSSLKSGQQLSGISIPRKIEDKPAISASLPKPVTQSSPQPNTPWAKIEMGQLEKSAVLNTQSTKPQLPIQNQTISTPLPAVIIPEKKTGINRTILFASIAGLAIVIAVAYWFFALRSTDPVVLETPTPTPVVLETPTPKLDSLISGQVLNVQLPVSGDPLATFKINAQSSVIAAGKLQTVQPTIEDGGIVIQLKPDILLDRFLVAYPASMKAVFAGPDSYIYYFGQREIFDKKGLIVAGEPISSRLVIVSEVQDATSTLVSMKAWETTMSADLNLLFELSYKKGVGAVFQDNTYKGNSIRYINFLWPDKSIDYAIVRASNGKQYLVISNSRESMYATVDKLSVSQR